MIVTDYNPLSETDIHVHTDMSKWVHGKKNGLFFIEQLTNVEGIMELEESPFANHHGKELFTQET